MPDRPPSLHDLFDAGNGAGTGGTLAVLHIATLLDFLVNRSRLIQSRVADHVGDASAIVSPGLEADKHRADVIPIHQQLSA